MNLGVIWAALLLCLGLLTQVHCSPLPETHSPHLRMKRMTPFWRGVSLRPIGASCRDNSECITLLCRKSRCSLNISPE
ncbi:liver-expressed antimicrobial peptide 2 [Ornithorhynchus anatinus]|uniref:liver-expressed antimicrobial peptide 2 n=1 Tax=Ornithorhynchus anatinus TaxID=9258 RepID=UPI0010A7DFEB|nr:liver-expressed antimicrobial peptide 2 [Ornithorhynchus anatinus]